MKNLIQKVFLGIIAVLIIVLGGSIFSEFMANHTYYNDMFASRKNWKLIIGAIISAGVPVLYLLKNRSFSLKKFTIRLFLGLLLFSFIHVIVNDSFVAKGLIIYIVNILLLFVFGAYFLTGVLALGAWISKLIKFKENRIQEMLLNFGIGLGALLILVDILIGFKIFHPAVAWIIFLGLGFLVWYMRAEMKHYATLISDLFAGFRSTNLKKNRWKWLLLILLVFSIIYYYYGFQLSFIPYSTAWDANHAYMYTPKIIAENFGLLWGNVGTAGTMPFLRYAFITFWFSIGSIFSGGRLSPDTIAVSMNFLSGPLCLIFGVALIKEVMEYFSEKINLDENAENLTFGTGWMMLLLWLCSGMGAFLVFVDNKTDLGVMALTILAILSGFIFIRYIGEHKSKKLFDKDSLKYLISSGVLFAFASMAKPSAFIDVVVFGLILVSLWINEIIALGLGISALGLMGIMHVQNAADFMTTGTGKLLFVVGVIVILIGLVLMFVRHKKDINEKKSLFSYICIWGLSIFAALVVFKGPWLAYGQHLTDGFNVVDWGKGLFLSMEKERNESLDHSKLYAANTDLSVFEDQNSIDVEYLQESESTNSETSVSASVSAEQCMSLSYSDDELKEGVKKAEVTNEDVGRYVGYGWKTFGNSTKGITYSILKLFYGKNGKCYGFDKDAKTLCEHQSEIVAGNIDAMRNLKLKDDSVAGNILKEGLISYDENPDTLMDLVSDLKTYYQNNSIYRNDGLIYVPYRYLVPLNITFNWSLQNLSSYYTDIGFIWIFAYLFLVLSLIYALCKRDNKLISLSVSSIIGWAIWWAIGGGILWYGIGLIMWTILVMVVFTQHLLSVQKDDWHKVFYLIVFVLLGVWMFMQLFYNLIRISSQGSSGPFLWFKQSAGTVQDITDSLGVENNVKIGYSQKDVFDLQFPHYNKFIEYVKDRADNDGVLIAGTYIQYFLDNQKNLLGDGGLDRFWEQGSDEDLCKMYHRIKNKNIKYLVIDPNIASIVMGEGNESLFYRFFAKFDDSGKLISKGAMFMLTELIDKGYMKLLYSNNIGAKYAFTMTDDELISLFGNMSKDDLIYLRAQLSSARYMNNANELVNYIATILNSRMANGLAIGDIADVYGKIIDENKVINTMNVYLSNPQSLPTMVATLSQDERFVLLQYLNFYVVLNKNDNATYSEMLNNLLTSSLAGGSQLMVFELR